MLTLIYRFVAVNSKAYLVTWRDRNQIEPLAVSGKTTREITRA